MRLFSLGSLFTILSVSPCFAHKLNVDFGYYSLKAESPTVSSTSVTVNSLGTYSLSGNIPPTGPWELGLGYTVFFSKIFKGDMGFGPDFSLYYFPINSGSGIEYVDRNISYYEMEQIRPFVGLSFNQRQFQSIQSSYSGFGVSAGVEYQLLRQTAVRGQIKSQSLQGPSNTVMKWLEIVVGLQQQF